MNHDDDFILEIETEESRPPARGELTGWELVIFQLADEEDPK